jgi:hypothetical protein
MNTQLRPVDHSALKVNQAFIILLSLLAFVFSAVWLAIVVAVVMLGGTLLRKPGFIFIYRYLLKPLGIVKPDVLLDNPEPHRFSQAMGSVFITVGSLLLVFGLSISGWVLVWIVIALAALNLFGGFCVGCALYYWLTRLGVPGFTKQPPAGTFPGTRPKVEV